jgi:hypothetical protein
MLPCVDGKETVGTELDLTRVEVFPDMYDKGRLRQENWITFSKGL